MENTTIDVTKIFDIQEDKFEETKDIRIYERQQKSFRIDGMEEWMRIAPPVLDLSYHIEKGVGQLLVICSEKDFLECLINRYLGEDIYHKYGHLNLRYMVVNIDGRENIRLELNKDSYPRKESYFSITQEQFLKCCNAKKLEFKLVTSDDESIIVNGYYGFDPNSGAEIDEYGNAVPENDLILNFQALYNYAIDSTMFTDALQRRQVMDEWKEILSKTKLQEEEGEETNVVEEEPEKSNRDLLLTIIGVLLTLVGLILFLTDDSVFLCVIGMMSLVGGTMLFGVMDKN